MLLIPSGDDLILGRDWEKFASSRNVQKVLQQKLKMNRRRLLSPRFLTR